LLLRSSTGRKHLGRGWPDNGTGQLSEDCECPPGFIKNPGAHLGERIAAGNLIRISRSMMTDSDLGRLPFPTYLTITPGRLTESRKSAETFDTQL
jgi:hypothetical protein